MPEQIEAALIIAASNIAAIQIAPASDETDISKRFKKALKVVRATYLEQMQNHDSNEGVKIWEKLGQD